MWTCGFFLTFVVYSTFFVTVNAFLPLLSEEGPDCDAECEDETPAIAVCGTDLLTYDSTCEIERAKCRGHAVEIKHIGKCSEKARCEAQRAMMLKQKNMQGMLPPECKDDGSYADVQCHHSTGYCWCVDEDGKPIRGSSTNNARPNCGKTGKKLNRRRSNRGRRNRKVCDSKDRANFNANLIDIFESEYNRIDHPPTTSSPFGLNIDPLIDTHEKIVIQWKFDELDANGDKYLKKREVKDLKRMAKKVVKPKACAKTFTKYCDMDHDKKISKTEWSVCVGVDINNEQVDAEEHVLDDQPKTGSAFELSASGSISIRPITPGTTQQTRPKLRHEGRRNHPIESGGDIRSTLKDDDDEVFSDCRTARQTALDNHHQDPVAGIYIPECTEDGLYVMAQCHKSTEFCWCVHPKTGKPMRGTATQGFKPDCDVARKGSKSFKGCAQHKKQEFLDELAESFIKEMSEAKKEKSGSIEVPTAEKAARWKFSTIDENSNSVLDKKEWKVLKKEWQSFHKDGTKQKRRLRKCWRNLPRYCDENSDQKITMDEWLACTGVTRDFKGSLPKNTKRKGPNPFSTILKSD